MQESQAAPENQENQPESKKPSSSNLNRIVLVLAVVLFAGCVWKRHAIRRLIFPSLPLVNRIVTQTVDGQLAVYGPPTRVRLKATFDARGLNYPPQQIALVAFKDTRLLEVYCKDKLESSRFQYVCTYPILGASGVLGPKLREGDRQVPEGIYQLTLEPNTPYHLALRLNYPNPTDWSRAKLDGRHYPGSDILIHGTTGSIGCIAMGDVVSEDLFVLVADAANRQTELVVAPVDFREKPAPAAQETDPTWLPVLYDEIKNALNKYSKPVGDKQ